MSHSQRISGQTIMSLDNYFSDIVTTLETISTEPAVVTSLSTYESNSSYTNYLNNKQITVQLKNIMSLKHDINNIFIFNPVMDILVNANRDSSMSSIRLNSPFLKQVWRIQQETKYIKPTFFPTHSPDYYYADPGSLKVVSMSYPIRDFGFNSKNLAVCLIDFSFEKITRIIEHTKLGKSDSIILLDNEGSVIYSTDAKYIEGDRLMTGLIETDIIQNDSGNYNTEFSSEKLLVNYSTSKVTGWKLFYLSKVSEIQKNVDLMAIITITLVFIVIVFSIILSVIISKKSAKPIHELISYMRVVGRGNFNVRFTREGSYTEFKILHGGFNLMMDKINALFDEVYNGKMKQKEAEFKALQSVIHPHFLNNTLQVIHSLAILERTKDIEKVVTALGNLLEYTIYKEEKKVPIFKEMNYITDYLQIQNIRYDNTIQVHIEIEENVYSSYILKLLLQPLVENAVHHGLDHIAGERILQIRGSIEDGNIRFEVIDNGIGMTEQKYIEVIRNLEHKVVSETSIGLSNVQERIQIEYGAEYGVNIHSEYKKGTKVELIIPIDEMR